MIIHKNWVRYTGFYMLTSFSDVIISSLTVNHKHPAYSINRFANLTLEQGFIQILGFLCSSEVSDKIGKCQASAFKLAQMVSFVHEFDQHKVADVLTQDEQPKHTE